MAATSKRKSLHKNRLTRHKILKNACLIADRKGIDQLTMRKLAVSLDVEAMSLYNHVTNKNDVIDGIVELVCLEFQLPDLNNHWRDALRDCAISTHQALLNHPWAASLMLSRVNISEPMLRYSDACYGCLKEAGFTYEQADHSWNAISNHINGFTLTNINSPVKSDDYAKAARHYSPQVPQDQYPHLYNMMQLIIDGTHSGVNDFEFGLDLILDALETRLLATQ